MLQGLPSKFSVTLCAGAAITLTAGRERISWVATLSSTSLSQVSQPVSTSHRFPTNGTEDFLILASANIPSSLEGEEQEWVWRRITWSRSPPHPPLSPGLTACPPGGRQAHESSSRIAPLSCHLQLRTTLLPTAQRAGAVTAKLDCQLNVKTSPCWTPS